MRARTHTPFDTVRRGPGAGASGARDDGFVRQSYTLPREEAREVAREWLRRYPKQGYDTAVESWSVVEGDQIRFTMRRSATAD